MSDFSFKDTSIYPKYNVDKTEPLIHQDYTVNSPSLDPLTEANPINIVNIEPVQEVKQEVKAVKNNTNKIAVYALRTLTLPGGTIEKGYSYIAKSQYEKVSGHKAIRIASEEEIKAYLK